MSENWNIISSVWWRSYVWAGLLHVCARLSAEITDLSYVVRYSWWFVFHIIKLPLPWSLVVVSAFLFPCPESPSVWIVSFKIKTKCFSCTNLVIFDCKWKKFNSQTHKPPLYWRVSSNVFPYLVWTLSLRSLPSGCSHRILPPSVILNSNKRIKAVAYIYLRTLRNRWVKKAKKARKKQFSFTSSSSIVVVDCSFRIVITISYHFNCFTKWIRWLPLLEPTHSAFRGFESQRTSAMWIKLGENNSTLRRLTQSGKSLMVQYINMRD